MAGNGCIGLFEVDITKFSDYEGQRDIDEAAMRRLTASLEVRPNEREKYAIDVLIDAAAAEEFFEVQRNQLIRKEDDLTALCGVLLLNVH